jgi:TusA-related sulfurtransferase
MKVVDAIGKLCPQPIIDLAVEVRKSNSGEIIQLLSDDPATWADLQAWSRMTGNLSRQTNATTFEVEA